MEMNGDLWCGDWGTAHTNSLAIDLVLCIYLLRLSRGGPSSGAAVTEPVTEVPRLWFHLQNGNLGERLPQDYG